MKSGSIHRKILAGLMLLSLAGCTRGFGSRDTYDNNEWVRVPPNARLENATMYRDVQFADIPVPTGYQLIPQESYSFQGSLFRSGIIKYDGPIDPVFAMSFFSNQLPARGWRLEKTQKGSGNRALYFAKGQENLIVIVRPLPDGSRVELQLDSRDKNDLLLKGKLTDPGYQAPPMYMNQGNSGVAPENTLGASPIR